MCACSGSHARAVGCNPCHDLPACLLCLSLQPERSTFEFGNEHRQLTSFLRSFIIPRCHPCVISTDVVVTSPTVSTRAEAGKPLQISWTIKTKSDGSFKSYDPSKYTKVDVKIIAKVGYGTHGSGTHSKNFWAPVPRHCLSCPG